MLAATKASFIGSLKQPIFPTTANLILSRDGLDDWLRSADTYKQTAPLFLRMPPSLCVRVVLDSVICKLRSRRKGTFSSHRVICAAPHNWNLVTVSSVLACLVSQLLEICPRLWSKTRELYDSSEVMDILDGRSAHLRESLLWKLLATLLSGFHNVPVFVVVSYFGDGRVPTTSDRSESNIMDSVPATFSHCVTKLIEMSTRIDCNFSILVILPATATTFANTFLTASHLVLTKEFFKNSLRDDVKIRLDRVVGARSLTHGFRDKLLSILQSPDSDPLSLFAFLQYIESRNLISPVRLEGELSGSLALGSVLKAALETIPEIDRAYARDILLFICFATRPLSIAELLFAESTPADIMAIQTWFPTPVNTARSLPLYFSSLVYFDGQRCHPYHPVLMEVLCGELYVEDSEIPWYYLGPSPHLDMAERCLDILKLSAHIQMELDTKLRNEDAESRCSSDSSDRFGLSALPHVYGSLFEYAALNWTTHLAHGATDDDTEAEVANILSRIDETIFQEWQRLWYMTRSHAPLAHGAQPTLQLLPFTLMNRTWLSPSQIVVVISEAIQILESVDGQESIALTWGIARAENGVSSAKEFWMDEIPENSKSLHLLIRNFGRDPALAFRLLMEIDPEFVYHNVEQLLLRDMKVGGDTVLGYLRKHPELKVEVKLPATSKKGQFFAAIGLTESIKYILSYPNPNITFIQDSDYSPGKRDISTCDQDESNLTNFADGSRTLDPLSWDRVITIFLHMAIVANDVDAVTFLLAHCAPAESTDEDGTIEIALASENGFHTILECLLQRKKYRDIPWADKMGPLRNASQGGHYRTASLLLDHSAKSADFKIGADDPMLSPVLAAVKSNRRHLVELFVKKILLGDADIMYETRKATQDPGSNEDLSGDSSAQKSLIREDFTFAVTEAIVRGFSDIARCLIENGVELDQVDDNGNSLIHLAAMNGMAEVIDAILTRQIIDIDKKNNNGETALRLALKQGSVSCVSVLLDGGADAKIPDAHGYTPLELASSKGSVDIVRMLLGTMPNKDQLGEPLQEAAIEGHVEIVTLLLDAGADKNYTNSSGNSALQFAAFWNQDRVVEVLLRRQVSLELKDQHGRTALADATLNRHTRIIKLLLDAGADIDAKDYNGRTPLEHAVRRGHENNCLLLLHRGAKGINNRDSSLLLTMFEKSMQKAIKYLLETRSLDLDFIELMHQAIESDNASMVSLLLDHGAEPDKLQMPHPRRRARILGHPIHLAAFLCKPNALGALLNHKTRKSDVNDLDGFYGTALRSCLKSNEDSAKKIELFRLLIKHNADPAITYQDGTLLHLAVSNSTLDVIEVVQEACRKSGLTSETRDSEKRLISHLAAVNGYSGVLKGLDIQATSLNERDAQGRLPIHFAAGAGSLAALRYIYETLGRPNFVECLGEVDEDGWNSLHWACRQMDKYVVDNILYFGKANLRTSKTNESWTAEIIAIRHNNSHMLPSLRGDDSCSTQSTDSDEEVKAWGLSTASCGSCLCVRYPKLIVYPT